jgi:hypothetical protein
VTTAQRSGPPVTGQRSAQPAPALRPLRILPVVLPRSPAMSLQEAKRRSAEDRAAGPRYVQDALALDYSLADDDLLFGPQPTRRADLPDPQPWAARLGQAIVEVMAGHRPAVQLVRFTTPTVYAVIARAATRSAQRRTSRSGSRSAARTRILVRRVVVCEPADGVAEASLVVADGTRVRAVAMRLIGSDGRWRVEALQIG